MKKSIFFGILMIFVLSASMTFAATNNLKSAKENSAVTVITDSKLSAVELTALTERVEAIRTMDKSNMTVTEKRELRKELKGIKENVRRDGGVIYIGGGTLLLIIILIILL
jgi:3-dehydroquinate synthetase